MKSSEFAASAADDVRIACTLREGREGRPLVVLLHGFSSGQNNSTNCRLFEPIHDLGMSSLAFDFRGCGRSGGDLTTTTISSGVLDLRAAIAATDKEAPQVMENGVAFVASSYGAAVALAACREMEALRLLLKAPMIDIVGAQESRRSASEMELWRVQGSIETMASGSRIMLDWSYVSDALNYDLYDPEGMMNPATPVDIVHGVDDEVAPFRFSQRFVSMRPSVRTLFPVEGASHRFAGPGHFDKMISVLVGGLGKIQSR